MQTLGMGLKVAIVCHLTGVQTTVPYSEAFEPYPCEATGRVATMARLHVKVRNGTQMFGRGSIERKCVRLWCRTRERTATRSMPASVAQLPTLLKCALQATLEARRWLWGLCRWGFVPAQTLRFFDGHKCIPVNETQWQARSLLGDEPSTVRPWAERRICGVRCRISGMRRPTPPSTTCAERCAAVATLFTGPYTLSNGLVQRCDFTGTGLPGALVHQAYYWAPASRFFACVSKRCPRQPLASPQSRCCNCHQNRLSSATQAHASTCPH